MEEEKPRDLQLFAGAHLDLQSTPLRTIATCAHHPPQPLPDGITSWADVTEKKLNVTWLSLAYKLNLFLATQVSGFVKTLSFYFLNLRRFLKSMRWWFIWYENHHFEQEKIKFHIKLFIVFLMWWKKWALKTTFLQKKVDLILPIFKYCQKTWVFASSYRAFSLFLPLFFSNVQFVSLD